MKRITLLTVLLSIAAITFSQTTLVCPQFFRRNNGVGSGGCDAQITFFFAVCPDPPIQVTALLTGGIYGTPIAGLTFTTGIICDNGKIEVCVTGSNIPPAGSLTVVFSDGTNSYTCEVPEAGPSPVQLSSFLVKRTNSTVAIIWQTASEINAKEFVLQRKNGNDFVDVATITANNRLNGSSYSYIDNNTSKGITEYRLKLVDLDGSYKNSDIRAIKGLSGSTDFTVYPNPSRGNATIVLSETYEKAVVQLMDNAGRVIKTENMLNNSSTNFRNLVPGMYLLKVTNTLTGEATSKKLTVIQ